MLDWPAFGDALWRVSDELGIRPEWALPVLFLESGFDPAITNPGNCVGINQFCPSTYNHYVQVPVNDYRAWSASRQLSGPVFDYWRDAQNFGPIRSATRVMLAQLGHKLLQSAPDLNSVVYAAPSREYAGNARVFDPTGKGYFTVADIANVVAHKAKNLAVCEALAYAYALRPNERPRDPVYGDDFPGLAWGFSCPDIRIDPPIVVPSRGKIAAVVVVATTLVAAVGYGVYRAARSKPSDRLIPPWRPPPSRPFRYTIP